MDRLRRWLTARATDVALAAGPRLSPQQIAWLEQLLARNGARLPIIARIVADNMRAAGVYTPVNVADHFAQVAAHFAGALHILRCAARRREARPSEELADLARERIALDDSVQRLRGALRDGRGAILVGPHINQYMLNLPRLSYELPLTAYQRRSKHAGRQCAKQRWCEATGLTWLAASAIDGPRADRFAGIRGVVNDGRALFITPDLPRKLADGRPVRLFDREICLPAGPAVLALRTGAPLFMLVARLEGANQRLLVRGPAPSPHGNARNAVQQYVQWFATELERFVREQPALWHLWADKRWTRVFRRDPRYVRPSAAPTWPPASNTPVNATGAM